MRETEELKRKRDVRVSQRLEREKEEGYHTPGFEDGGWHSGTPLGEVAQ